MKNFKKQPEVQRNESGFESESNLETRDGQTDAAVTLLHLRTAAGDVTASPPVVRAAKQAVSHPEQIYPRGRAATPFSSSSPVPVHLAGVKD